MNNDAKRLHLIRQVLKITDESVLDELEIFVNQRSMHVTQRTSFKDFAGVLSDDEVENLEKIIEEGCERN